MSFHDLSVEICTMILQELAYIGNFKTLSSLSQVSWSLYHLGNPILYEWNIKHQDCSAFYRAVFNDRVDIVKKFLEYGVPVNHLLPYNGFERVTPLWQAAKSGSIEIVRHFFTLPGVDWNWVNRFRETPLHAAIQYDHIEMARLLLTHPETSVNAENIAGWTALTFAVTEGCEELIELLLAMDSVDPDHRTLTGQSALWMAADWGKEAGVVKLLLDTGRVDVNLVTTVPSMTPLIAAIVANRPETVRLLVNHPDIDVNLTPNGCEAPISIAVGADISTAVEADISTVEADILEIVEILLQHPDTDPDRADDPNEAPILRAANLGYGDIFCVLLADARVGPESRRLLGELLETLPYSEEDAETDAYSE